MNLHPLVTEQNSQSPQTRMDLVRKEAENLNAGKSINVLGRELGLNPQQVAFAIAYASYDELGSNGKAAAARSYGFDLTIPKEKQAAANTANRLLKHPQVNLLIAIILDCSGYNNEYVDKKLMQLIEQNADPKTAIMAISEYNKVQNRIKTQVEVVHKQMFDPTVLNVEQLDTLVKLIEQMKINSDHSRTIDATYTEIKPDNPT